MYQSQQRLENSSFIKGLLAAVLLYALLIAGYYYLKPAKKEAPVLNITKIDLDMFEIGGGLNDTPPTPDIAPTPPIDEVLEAEEIIEDEVEVVEEVIEDEVEVVEEVIEPIEEAEVDESVFEPKPEPEPKKEQPKKVEKKKPAPKKVVKKPTNSGGYNAYNPNANKIASSAITGENTTQALSASEKSNISSQIQAIIAKEAIKNYPKQARARRQQGTVTISFTYSPNGSVTNVRITKSSGHKILDNTVINVINKAKVKFPPIKAQTTFSIPIKFSIR